jgi:hypothetical protein
VTESNARLVRWSDGSASLVLGDEVYDVVKNAMSDRTAHLFSVNSAIGVEVHPGVASGASRCASRNLPWPGASRVRRARHLQAG